jgi:hypothetical protein
MAMQRAAQLLPQLRAAVQAGDQKAQALLTELKVGGVLMRSTPIDVLFGLASHERLSPGLDDSRLPLQILITEFPSQSSSEGVLPPAAEEAALARAWVRVSNSSHSVHEPMLGGASVPRLTHLATMACREYHFIDAPSQVTSSRQPSCSASRRGTGGLSSAMSRS